MSSFEEFFARATVSGSAPQGRCPFPWQIELAAARAPRHNLIRIPTGFGKTLGVALAWTFHRVVRNDLAWPSRLVWMLPMRTLVEQTESECRRVLRQLGLERDGTADSAQSGKVGVHVLMGGADTGDFHLRPEQPAILIGTQDMLLSRAMNRGYGAARARWPVDFGLLSQDALWVLDEVQLMGVGFATALQLAAFRQESPALRPTYTWAMSATLQEGWVRRSPDTCALADSMPLVGLGTADQAEPLWADSVKPVSVIPAPPGGFGAGALARRVVEEHRALARTDALTLVVCNVVDRAREVFDAVRGLTAGSQVSVHLIHSRFRGRERAGWAKELLGRDSGGASRIIVATQVVEAGVDISADLLFTEICPWPSLVQRLGRLARRVGEHGAAYVQGLDTAKLAAPYEPDEVDAAWDAIRRLTDGSPRSLERFEIENPGLLAGLYPFDPPHLLLRDEIDELFDTTADLSGGDIDVSRFIREGDERDLTVAWVPIRWDGKRAVPPSSTLRLGREALCAVPFLRARDWLCGKKTKTGEPQALRKDVAAFVWDYIDGVWRPARRPDLRAGAQVLVDCAVGGYDDSRGFDAEHRGPVSVVPVFEADEQERTESSQDHDDLSMAGWQTIAFHGASAAARLGPLLGAVLTAPGESDLSHLLDLAARWHDLGKSHPAFQGAIRQERRADRPSRQDLAKAPEDAWGGGACMYRMGEPPEYRPGLRHELASALGLFDVLVRWAPAHHGSRLGAWAGVVEGESPRSRGEAGPSAVEREVLDLAPDDFDLVVFLVCSHHGKVRARLNASALDQRAAVRSGSLPIRGVYEGDGLPALELQGRDGARYPLPASILTLEPAVLGLSERTGRSWTERVDRVRGRFGPFALAYLEALLRAADVLASKDKSLVDPALHQVGAP